MRPIFDRNDLRGHIVSAHIKTPIHEITCYPEYRFAAAVNTIATSIARKIAGDQRFFTVHEDPLHTYQTVRGEVIVLTLKEYGDLAAKHFEDGRRRESYPVCMTK